MKHKIFNSVLFAGLAAMTVYAAESVPRPAKTNQTGAAIVPRIGPVGNGQAGKGLASPAVERLANMSPEQRKKALQKLPPDRRKKLEERLNQYDRLTPSQKAKLYGQYENFKELPAEHQAHLRRLFQRFNNFPPERQDALRAEVQKMQTLSDPDRRARMNSDEFRNRYDQRERALLAELAKTVPSN